MIVLAAVRVKCGIANRAIIIAAKVLVNSKLGFAQTTQNGVCTKFVFTPCSRGMINILAVALVAGIIFSAAFKFYGYHIQL